MTKTKFRKLDVADRNLELALEFNRFVLEHPEITDKLPQEAHIFFLPQDDPELCEFNKKLAQEEIENGEPVVFVTIEEVRLQLKGLSFQTSKDLPREEVLI